MNVDIIGSIVALISGFLVALINYILSKTVLTKTPEKYSLATVVRQVFQVCFLVAVYFIGDKIQAVNTVYLLVGAAFGMTVPMIYVTKKLLFLNQSTNRKEKEMDGDVHG